MRVSTLVSIREVREALPTLKCSRAKLYRMVADGRIPAIRMGGRWLIRKKQLEKMRKEEGHVSKQKSRTAARSAA